MSLKSQSEIKPDIGIIDGEMMQHLTTKRGIKTKITKLTNSDRTVLFSTALWHSKKFFFANINDNDPNSTNHWVSVAIDKNDSIWYDGFDGKVAQTTYKERKVNVLHTIQNMHTIYPHTTHECIPHDIANTHKTGHITQQSGRTCGAVAYTCSKQGMRQEKLPMETAPHIKRKDQWEEVRAEMLEDILQRIIQMHTCNDPYWCPSLISANDIMPTITIEHINMCKKIEA